MTKKEKRTKIISSLLLLLGILIINFGTYILFNFSNVTFEEILYALLYSEGTGGNAISNGLIVIVPASILEGLLILFIFKVKPAFICDRLILNINEKQFHLFTFSAKRVMILSVSLLLISLIFFSSVLKVYDYVAGQFITSTFIEENYVDPRNVKIEFPEEKQNLIYIYAESLESSYVSSEFGGFPHDSYIPNLERMAKENINFSHNDKIGGALSLNGTTWTASAMIAQTGGIPLKLTFTGDQYIDYNRSYSGVYSLGDALKDNGYKNYFMMGDDANFGGRKRYFREHGDYEVLDYNWALEDQKIPKGYYVWWGYEDSKLFEFAKEKLTDISKEDFPFNFTLATLDTHFTDGYLEKTCDTPFDKKYANSYHCSDMFINEFVEWIKEQDWYKNTTIVIVGDHVSMQGSLITDSNYTRTVYNAIINSRVSTDNTKNRLFTTIDLYPTTLASLGVKIEGDKLGLGVNLFSSEPTLTEKYGFDNFDKEMRKRSVYYNQNIIGNKVVNEY